MSDTSKRDAITSARRLGKTAYGIRLVEEIACLQAENTALKAAVERVQALHTPIADNTGLLFIRYPVCRECDSDYPCPTLRALEEAP